MLRYFYLVICIPMCFCSVYVDNNVDYESVSRQARGQTARGLRKETRSLRSKVVQFDVQNFLQGPEEAVDDYRYYGYRDKKRDNKYTSSNLVNHETPNERSKPAEFVEHTSSRVNPRAQHKYNPRHFGGEDPHEHRKASYKQSKVTEKRAPGDTDGKCSFRNMRIPFFSRNKATAKAKRHKKRRIFCFNCKKTTTAARTLATTTTLDTPESKPEDSSKDIPNPAPYEKTNGDVKKISKRAYGQLCPKCIRGLLVNLKKKTTTKKGKPLPTHKASKATNKRTTKQKADLEDSLQEELNELNIGHERMKRNDLEEQERERRLKELEEVEKKIANVHIVTPVFRKDSLNSS